MLDKYSIQDDSTKSVRHLYTLKYIQKGPYTDICIRIQQRLTSTFSLNMNYLNLTRHSAQTTWPCFTLETAKCWRGNI